MAQQIVISKEVRYAIRSMQIPKGLTADQFAVEVQEYWDSYKHMGIDEHTSVRDVQDAYIEAAILDEEDRREGDHDFSMNH